VPIPGTTKLNRLDENLGATGVVLDEAEIAELDTASAKIQLQGDRYSPVQQQLVGR
jgi:aryl-alcohol dehydrogenase-like predicted oxidoreductase